jgi:glutamate-1-semialdehyde 2,1-aminomutase
VAGGASTLSKSAAVFPGNAPSGIDRGRGAYVWRSADPLPRTNWVDYVSGLLSVTLGHGNARVRDALVAHVMDGGPGWPGVHPLEESVADTLRRLCGYPDGRVRFLATGTHACETAVRIARAHTGRQLVLSIGYHGWSDAVLTAAPGWGLPPQTRRLTRTAPWGDLEAAEGAFFGLDPDGRGGIRVGAEDPTLAGEYLACVIVEPATLSEPPKGYLEGLRAMCRRFGALLIYDECITGGRYEGFTYGNTFGPMPDLCVVSKGLANGLPLAAVLGSDHLMECFDPGWYPVVEEAHIRHAPATGPVYASGTWSAPGLSLAAAEANLRIWEGEGVAARIREIGYRLHDLLAEEAAARLGALAERVTVTGQPYRLALDVRSESGAQTDYPALTYLRQQLVEHGVLCGTGFNVTVAHGGPGVLDKTLAAWERALDDLAGWWSRGSRTEELANGVVCRPPYRQA